MTDGIRELRANAPGWFVTFEGGEGSGKSMQLKRLAEALRATGRIVVETREPGGSAGAERVRALLLEPGQAPFDPLAETLLFFAARQEHLACTVRPALERGAIVLCDRFVDSSYAYQGVAGHVSRDKLDRLSAIVIGPTMPDRTLILDLDPAIGLARAAARRAHGEGDRFESDTLAFHTAVRHGFREVAATARERCRLVDASGTPDEVAARIRMSIADLLPVEAAS